MECSAVQTYSVAPMVKVSTSLASGELTPDFSSGKSASFTFTSILQDVLSNCCNVFQRLEAMGVEGPEVINPTM